MSDCKTIYIDTDLLTKQTAWIRELANFVDSEDMWALMTLLWTIIDDKPTTIQYVKELV